MNTPLSEQNILITGANGAMAVETIKHLIEAGARNLTMAVRSMAKGEEAKAQILQAYFVQMTQMTARLAKASLEKLNRVYRKVYTVCM